MGDDQIVVAVGVEIEDRHRPRPVHGEGIEETGSGVRGDAPAQSQEGDPGPSKSRAESLQ